MPPFKQMKQQNFHSEFLRKRNIFYGAMFNRAWLYFSNYYNISDEEISNRINKLSIKYPGSGFERGNVGTMVLKDKNGNFKILMLNLSRNEKEGITTIREMFTNEKLCDIKTTDLGTLTDKYGKRITANLNALTDISECLSDYEIYELGDFSYSTNFLEAHFDDVKAQYNLNNDNYSISSNVVNDFLYNCR